MNLQIYIIIGIVVIIALLLYWTIRLEMKFKKLLGGKKGTLDDALDTLRKDVDYLKKYSETASGKFQAIDNKLQKTIQGNETVRFNPFKGDGSGSNQSFATALVNADGDGVVLSSMYSRDHVSVFGKPIKNSKSEYELSAEEKMALQKAQESIV